MMMKIMFMIMMTRTLNIEVIDQNENIEDSDQKNNDLTMLMTELIVQI